jgi:hypothetical protein
MNDSPEPDEQPVEQALRELLDPLDRHLERGRTLLADVRLLELPPAMPAPPAAAGGPPTATPPAARPGGYYDYIALEPMPGDDRPADRQG